ncbi:MAG: hypothetical protein KJZ84_22835 [Bryobacteraceae bacterium]|nr:hypothetical protein [Bryobacteraceae bacterium]
MKLHRRHFLATAAALPLRAAGKTEVSIRGTDFLINGRPTYEGREWKGSRIEGMLMNSRMVQGVFDDENPETVQRWAYPDTGRWDPERNTREFLAAMPEWRRHGLLSFTINFQGGSPQGYSKEQPWLNNAFHPDGSLKPAFLNRMRRILDRADELGMTPIVGYFYFGQDEHLKDDAAVRRATESATRWLLAQDYRHVMVEVANECDNRAYQQPLIQAPNIHELIDLVKSIRVGGRRLLVSASYNGRSIPRPNLVKTADYLLIHGNGVKDPAFITEMVQRTREVEGYRPMPIVFNEDDHFDFDQPVNNFVNAVRAGASWGYFDPGASNYRDGYQCPPVQWGLNTERKKQFFGLVKEMTGA